MCGKTTLLMNGSHAAFVLSRSCSKNVDSVSLSTDDRRKLDNKTCVRKMYIQKACGATDDASDYESRKCRFGSCQARKRSFYSIAFGETEQDYPVDRHQKVFTATRHELINQRGYSLYFSDES